jgi:hypothetical protein
MGMARFLNHGSNLPFLVMFGLALIIGLVVTRWAARLFARWVDIGARGATAKHELSGKLGVVASPKLGPHFGEIRVRDERGNELLVHARIGDGEDPLHFGEEVVLVDYDPQSELFSAAAMNREKP